MKEASSIQNAVAVIGMSGRFPGAPDLDAFWNLLREGRDGVKSFAREELLRAGLPESLIDSPNFVSRRPILDHPLDFDPAFFGYRPEEASWIDPQQRVFLECAWEALETAGIDPAAFPGWIGVLAGCEMNSYILSRDLDIMRVLASASGKQFQVDSDKDYLATRVAYKLDLKGPAVTVQSACSTGMLAFQLGCQSLLVGQCDIALAGAVSISFPQERCHLQYEGGITSPDGICRPFDAEANGAVFGDGVAVLALRRLEDAITAGDPILAIVRATAANNDGNTKPGFLAPSVLGQESVISVALAMADVDRKTISYVEANGTGTPVGDSLEFHAIRKTYGRTVSAASPCTIGSVKSNIGHLTVVSGLAGMIKTILMMRHKQFVPTLHYRSPHPALQFEGSGFRIDSGLRPWECEGPRRAGVSCFGIGGTNAHVVLEEGPQAAPSGIPGPWTLLVTGKTTKALQASAQRLSEHLASHPHIDLGHVAFTLRTGRRHHAHRLAVTASDLQGAVAALVDEQTSLRAQHQVRGKRRVGLLFPDRGAEFVGMARGLYETVSQFRAHVDRCAAIAKTIAGLDLLSALRGVGNGEPVASSLAEAALFAVEYATASLWREAGVEPVALCGQGIGEIVAATVAGVLELGAGMQMACVRARMREPGLADGGQADLRRLVESLPRKAPQVPMLSSLTGAWLTAEQALDPEHWVQVLRGSHSYSPSAAALLGESAEILLQVGPGRAAMDAVLALALAGNTMVCIPSLRAAKDHASDEARLRQAAGALWAVGVKLDWTPLLPTGKAHRIHLPPMAFDRVRCALPERHFELEAASAECSKALPAVIGPTTNDEAPGPVAHRPDAADGATVGPRTDEERAVAAVWQELLHIPQVGMGLNFFDAGGNSISAIQVVAKLKARGWICEVDDVFRCATPEHLAKRLARSATEVREVAPFAMVDRDEAQVKALLEKHPGLEDLYPLTPIQEQVLAQNMVFRRTGGDVQSIESDIRGPLVFEPLRAAWLHVMRKHPILRTAMFWRRLPNPLQGVYAQPEAPVVFLDHTGLSDTESDRCLNELRDAQLREGFPLHQGLLWKAFVVRKRPDQHRLLWFYYGSLFDAWSAGILEKDLWSRIRGVHQGGSAASEPVRFANYVDWLRKRDPDSAKAFWQHHLRGFAPTLRAVSERVSSTATCSQQLNEDQTKRLAQFARSLGIPTNPVLQAAWAAVWARSLSSSDFLVGMVSSGRPAELAAIDEMAGLFTQVLPVRIQWDPEARVGEWMRGFEQRLQAIRREEHASTAQIQAWSGVPKEALREAILMRTMVFLNAKDATPEAEEDRSDFYSVGAESHGGVSVPLRLYVKPERELSLTLKYDPAQFSERVVARILDALGFMLSHLPHEDSATMGRWSASPSFRQGVFDEQSAQSSST